MNNVLAAVDFSDVTSRVIDTAGSIAYAYNAHLWVVHVEYLYAAPADFDAGPQSVRDTVAHELKEKHRQLEQIADALKAKGVDTTALLLEGPIEDEILKQASKTEAGLIVLGSHGIGGILSALMGSICESVIRNATTPVVVVPAKVDVPTA